MDELENILRTIAENDPAALNDIKTFLIEKALNPDNAVEAYDEMVESLRDRARDSEELEKLLKIRDREGLLLSDVNPNNLSVRDEWRIESASKYLAMAVKNIEEEYTREINQAQEEINRGNTASLASIASTENNEQNNAAAVFEAQRLASINSNQAIYTTIAAVNSSSITKAKNGVEGYPDEGNYTPSSHNRKYGSLFQNEEVSGKITFEDISEKTQELIRLNNNNNQSGNFEDKLNELEQQILSARQQNNNQIRLMTGEREAFVNFKAATLESYEYADITIENSGQSLDASEGADDLGDIGNSQRFKNKRRLEDIVGKADSRIEPERSFNQDFSSLADDYWDAYQNPNNPSHETVKKIFDREIEGSVDREKVKQFIRDHDDYNDPKFYPREMLEMSQEYPGLYVSKLLEQFGGVEVQMRNGEIEGKDAYKEGDVASASYKNKAITPEDITSRLNEEIARSEEVIGGLQAIDAYYGSVLESIERIKAEREQLEGAVQINQVNKELSGVSFISEQLSIVDDVERFKSDIVQRNRDYGAAGVSQSEVDELATVPAQNITQYYNAQRESLNRDASRQGQIDQAVEQDATNNTRLAELQNRQEASSLPREIIDKNLDQFHDFRMAKREELWDAGVDISNTGYRARQQSDKKDFGYISGSASLGGGGGLTQSAIYAQGPLGFKENIFATGGVDFQYVSGEIGKAGTRVVAGVGASWNDRSISGAYSNYEYGAGVGITNAPAKLGGGSYSTLRADYNKAYLGNGVLQEFGSISIAPENKPELNVFGINYIAERRDSKVTLSAKWAAGAEGYKTNDYNTSISRLSDSDLNKFSRQGFETGQEPVTGYNYVKGLDGQQYYNGRVGFENNYNGGISAVSLSVTYEKKFPDISIEAGIGFNSLGFDRESFRTISLAGNPADGPFSSATTSRAYTDDTVHDKKLGDGSTTDTSVNGHLALKFNLRSGSFGNGKSGKGI